MSCAFSTDHALPDMLSASSIACPVVPSWADPACLRVADPESAPAKVRQSAFPALPAPDRQFPRQLESSSLRLNHVVTSSSDKVNDRPSAESPSEKSSTRVTLPRSSAADATCSAVNVVRNERVVRLRPRRRATPLDCPARRLVRARRALQRQPRRLDVQQEIVTAQTAEKRVNFPRESVHHPAEVRVRGTHISSRGPLVAQRRHSSQAECQPYERFGRTC